MEKREDNWGGGGKGMWDVNVVLFDTRIVVISSLCFLVETLSNTRLSLTIHMIFDNINVFVKKYIIYTF